MSDYSINVGSFSAVTTGTQPAITGLGFIPKAIIFFWTNQNTIDDETLVGSESHYGIAFTDQNRKYGQCINEYEWANATRGGRAAWTDYVIERWIRTDTTYTIDGRVSQIYFDTDGFRIIWSDYPSTAFRINYIAFGGVDLVARVGTTTIPNTTGDKYVSGIGFQPETIFFAAASGDGGTTGSSTTFYADMFGVACSGGSKSVSNVAWPLTTNVMNRNDASIWGTEGGSTARIQGTVTSYRTDGFTINISDAPAASQVIGYLATNLVCITGSDNWNGNADSSYSITGIGGTPIGLMTHIAVANTTSTVNSNSVGAVRQFGTFDGTTSRDVAAGGSGNNPVAANAIQTNKLSSLINPDSGIQTQITPVSLDADGFTVDFSSTTGSSRAWSWVALGVGQESAQQGITGIDLSGLSFRAFSE